MKFKAAVLASALALSCWRGAAAAEPPAAADPDPWRFTVALYGWAMSVSANLTVRRQAFDTNASFIDLLQKSDSLIGFMGYFEADKGRVGFYTDLVFARLGFGAGQTAYRNPIAGLKISATANAVATYQLFIVEMGGVYELVRWPGSTEGTATAIDGILGFRYWNNTIDANLDVTANVNFSNLGLERSFGLAVARSGVVQWVDPVLGLRLRHDLTPNQQIMVRGDIGGFGLSGSQFAWQAVATYAYTWQHTGWDVAALVGFRALGVNYSQGSGADGLTINEVLYGPIIGVRFRF